MCQGGALDVRVAYSDIHNGLVSDVATSPLALASLSSKP